MDFVKLVANKWMPAQEMCSIKFFKLTLDSSQAKWKYLDKIMEKSVALQMHDHMVANGLFPGL